MTIFSLVAALALSASANADFFSQLGATAACLRDRPVSDTIPSVAAKPVATNLGAPAQEEPLSKRFPQIKACEAAASKLTSYYFAPEALLITATHVYYLYASCDICNDIDACELKTGKMSTVHTAHVLSCSDLEPQRKGAKIVYDCKK
jgi:hypothetical protein